MFFRSRQEFDDSRVYRADHLCQCKVCGREYWCHPEAREPHLLSYDGEPYLHRLCNGDLVKL